MSRDSKEVYAKFTKCKQRDPTDSNSKFLIVKFGTRYRVLGSYKAVSCTTFLRETQSM